MTCKISSHALLTTQEHNRIAQRLMIMQKAHQKRGKQRIGYGNVVIIAFTCIALAMAWYALYREDVLNKQEQHIHYKNN